MPTYYFSLSRIEQETRQLDQRVCRHCKQSHQLLSHGFIRKKTFPSEPVGKRVFCSNRNKRTGCGRTMAWYLASVVRTKHYSGSIIIAFILAFIRGATIQEAYLNATRAASPRHAYRWLHQLESELSTYRSLFHQPLIDSSLPTDTPQFSRRSLLSTTFEALLDRFAQPLCETYQLQLQRSFF
jgi:hypothetical protein